MSVERELWERARAILRPADGTRDERVAFLVSALSASAPEALAAALDRVEAYYARLAVEGSHP